MNKVLTSAGLLALGAAAVYGYDPEMTRARTGRPWTVSAVVRGFYDSNPTTSVDSAADDSFGFEVSPSVHVNLPLEQTFIRAGYVYSLRYYEDREPDNDDQSHEFNALLRHAFSPRHEISVTESFIYSQEPTVVDKDGIVTSPLRTDAAAMHNHLAIDYNVGLTRLLGLGLGYANEWYNYEDSGPASRSAYLDRLEHFLHADLRYQATPKLVGLIGYQLGLRQYTADEYLFGTTGLKSEARDSTSHFLYVGADHDFSSQLRASIRIGGQYTDYDEVNEDEISPYVDASLAYAYLPGSSVRVGVKHQRVATDYVAADPSDGTPTLDQEVTAGYVSVMHQITRDFTANVIGQIQHGTFTDGASDNRNEVLYLIGVNLAYSIDEHWGLEGGYNFDLLDSEARGVDRDFDRHRVYVGVRATY
jgi:hypothetical protein